MPVIFDGGPDLVGDALRGIHTWVRDDPPSSVAPAWLVKDVVPFPSSASQQGVVGLGREVPNPLA